MANLFESPRYIAVEGPIRVGKSTLARILAERLECAAGDGAGGESVSRFVL